MKALRIDATSARVAAIFARIVLCTAMVALTMGVGVQPAWALWGDKYTTSYDTSWYKAGSKTFHIKTAKQLAGLAYLCMDDEYDGFKGCDFILDNDIDLSGVCGEALERSWRPIGCTGGDGKTLCPAFRGNFDGKDHTISNLYINKEMDDQALFGDVAGGKIQNLTVKGNVTASEKAAGIIASCSNEDLENLTSEVEVEARGNGDGHWNGNAGGVVGYAMTVYGKQTNTYTKLINKGKVTGTGSYTGGVFGYMGSDKNTNLNMSQCANEGKVTVDVSKQASANTKDADKAVGGLVGSTTSNKYGGKITVTECYNTGDVSATNMASGGGCLAISVAMTPQSVIPTTPET